MESIGTLIITVVASLVIGFLFSLPMLIPPLRRWAQNIRAVRIASIIIFGLLVYSILLVSLTRLTLESILYMGCNQ